MLEGFESYPLQLRAPKRPARPLALRPQDHPVAAFVLGVLLIPGGAAAAAFALHEGEPLVAVLLAWFCLVLGLAGIGGGLRDRGPREPFRCADAALMLRPEHLSEGARIHIAGARALPLPLILCFILIALGTAVTVVVSLLQLIGAMPRLNEEAGGAGIATAALGAAVLGGASAWTAWRHGRLRWRNSRFGAHPRGVALCEQGVILAMPRHEGEFAWDHILAVEPELRRGRHPVAMIRLELAPDAHVAGDVQLIRADAYAVPRDALYSALRWYRKRPEARWELGRAEGSQRLEEWRQEAVRTG